MLFLERKVLSAITIALLLGGMYTVAFNIQPVNADGEAIYIRADGSIDPPTAPLATSDNVTYALTSDVNGSIVIERNSIILDGADHTIQGTGTGTGIAISGRSNVKVQNTTIALFQLSIDLESSSDNIISGNNLTGMSIRSKLKLDSSDRNTITENVFYNCSIYMINSSANCVSRNAITACVTGIDVSVLSHYNSIVQNNITDFTYGISVAPLSNCNYVVGNNLTGYVMGEYSGNLGIVIGSSGNYVYRNCIAHCPSGIIFHFLTPAFNKVIGNNVTGSIAGIAFGYDALASNNTIVGNNLSNNYFGFHSTNALDNSVYHNNLIGNSYQIDSHDSANFWDDGYPSGGNYWSAYNGTDFFKGAYQNETGSDGIGDTPYFYDENNTDRYPLLHPYVLFLGDVNLNGEVDLLDAIQVASFFGSKSVDLGWNPLSDLNMDGIVDIYDVILLASNFGKTTA